MNKVTRKLFLALGLYDKIVDFKNWTTNTEKKYIKFYSRFVNQGDLCFDIGANVGRRTRVLLKINTKVVAVEPHPQCMRVLKKKYNKCNNVTLVQKAVGECSGQEEMMMCNAHSLSSLSKEWVENVKSSGRYAQCNWNKKITVNVTTLDDLIREYGKPVFIKIDAEGYEDHIIKGLSQPIPVICFEFTPEFMDSAFNCIKHLAEMEPAKFNYCTSENPYNLILPNWVDAEQLRQILTSKPDNSTGDIFARFGNYSS